MASSGALLMLVLVLMPAKFQAEKLAYPITCHGACSADSEHEASTLLQIQGLDQAQLLADLDSATNASASCDTGNCCPGTISDADWALGPIGVSQASFSGRCKAQADGCNEPCRDPVWPFKKVFCSKDQVCRCGDKNGCVNAPKPRTTNDFMNIAHMANTISSIDWAVSYGANGIEADLNYNGQMPLKFMHGGFCDCTCQQVNPFKTESICKPLNNDCEASTPPDELLAHAIRQKLALFYFDNKVHDAWSEEQQAEAGKNLGKLAAESLLKKGFAGKVLVGVPKLKFLQFLKGAKQELDSSLNEVQLSQVFYSIDQESSFQEVLTALQTLGTKQISYGVGISTCVPFVTYYESVKAAAEAKAQGKIADNIIWTLDDEDSMVDYIAKGASGIMSNMPYSVNYAVAQRGLALAKLTS